MSKPFKYFLIGALAVSALGLGLLIGYHNGFKHGYAFGVFDGIKLCSSPTSLRQ